MATRSGERRQSSWFRRPSPAPGARVRLVCFPHAGGAASFYARWPRLAGPLVEVLCVQYPGREEREGEPFAGSVEEIAAGVAAELDGPVAGSGRAAAPVALFGHSLGAVVAYETARRLRAAPRHLFASGRPAPDEPETSTLHLGGDDALLTELRRLGGTPEELLADPVVRSLVLSRLRADYRLNELYRHAGGPPLDAPVTALLGGSDPEVDAERAERWKAHTSAAFDTEVFPGDHFYLAEREEEVVAAVLARLGLPRVVARRWPSTP